MTTYNVRNDEDDSGVPVIIFGSDGENVREESSETFIISEDYRRIELYKEDIPYLIRALEKAKELGWC